MCTSQASVIIFRAEFQQQMEQKQQYQPCEAEAEIGTGLHTFFGFCVTRQGANIMPNCNIPDLKLMCRSPSLQVTADRHLLSLKSRNSYTL